MPWFGQYFKMFQVSALICLCRTEKHAETWECWPFFRGSYDSGMFNYFERRKSFWELKRLMMNPIRISRIFSLVFLIKFIGFIDIFKF